jgi:FkbM family methyltransferase
MNRLLSMLASRLPQAARRRLKKWYYPFLLRRFAEDRWPPSRAVRALVHPGDHVVDAGANIGYVTGLLSRWAGPAGRVYSFEPVPETFDLLSHNARRLGWTNVSLFNIGLSSAEGTATMRIPRYTTGAENLYESRLVSEEQPGFEGRAVTVSLRPLDAVLVDPSLPLALLKVDVEGHELEVIRGAHGVIERWKPALLVEVGGDPRAPGTPASELFGLLAEAGYSAWVCDPRSCRVLPCGERATDYLFLQANHLTKLEEAGILSGHDSRK